MNDLCKLKTDFSKLPPKEKESLKKTYFLSETSFNEICKIIAVQIWLSLRFSSAFKWFKYSTHTYAQISNLWYITTH